MRNAKVRNAERFRNGSRFRIPSTVTVVRQQDEGGNQGRSSKIVGNTLKESETLQPKGLQNKSERSTTDASYPPRQTALLVVDPYNDFLSEGGKMWPYLKEVAETVGLVDNLKRIYASAREKGIKIFIVPHHRWSSQDALDWNLLNPDQIGSRAMEIFAPGSWGGEWHPDFAPRDGDVVIKEHMAQNGFTNTDLDLQLRQHGMERVICVGLIANTCIEATARYAMELGYHVTLVRDATAAFSLDRMKAAHDLNGPTYAHAIFTTSELLDAIADSNSPI